MAVDEEKNTDASWFDHQTLVAKGAIRVKANGKETIFTAPHCVFIRAGVEHELTALEDGTITYCIHALRDGNDVCDIVPPGSIPLGEHDEGKISSVAMPLIVTPDDKPTPHLNQ
jgi:hypothetical protein